MNNRSPKPRVRKNRRKGQRCQSNSPKGSHSILSFPPPPLPGPPRLHPTESLHLKSNPNNNVRAFVGTERSSRDLAKTRLHLKGVQVIRKQSIVVSGLPRATFHSMSLVQEHFGRYGKICQCVENPKGIGLAESEIGNDEQFGAMFITFMNEKSVSLAVRDIINSKDTSGTCLGVNVQCRLGHSTYCNEFLSGKHCRNLDCVLMHEDVKIKGNNYSSHSNSSTSPRSLSSAAKSFQESFRTAPTILRKEKGLAGAGVDTGISVATGSGTKKCWSTPRSFLDAATGILNDEDKNERSETGSFRGNEEEDFSTCDSFDDGMDTRSCGGFQLIVTPDSTLTKSTFSDATLSSLKTSRSHSECMDTSISKGLAKQLFASHSGNQANFGIISPPIQTARTSTESEQSMQTFCSPWDIQSPIQLEKDNFSSMKKNPPSSNANAYFGQPDILYNENSNQSNALIHRSVESKRSTQRNPGINNCALLPRPNAFPPQRNTFHHGYRYNHHQHQPQISVHYPHCYHQHPTFPQQRNTFHHGYRYNHHQHQTQMSVHFPQYGSHYNH